MTTRGTLFEDAPSSLEEAKERAQHVAKFLTEEVAPSWLNVTEAADIRIVRPVDTEGFGFLAILYLIGFKFDALRDRLPYVDDFLEREGSFVSETVLTSDATSTTLMVTVTPITEENAIEGHQLTQLFGEFNKQDKRRLH